MVVVEVTIPATVIINAVCLLLRAVNNVREETSKFQSNLDDLQTTLVSLKSTLDEIETASQKVAFRNPKNTVKSFVQRLEKGNKLVSYCSKFHPINFVGKYFHNRDLLKLNKELIKFHQSEMLAEVIRDNKLILSQVQSLHHKVDQLLVPSTSSAGRRVSEPPIPSPSAQTTYATVTRFTSVELVIFICIILVAGLILTGIFESACGADQEKHCPNSKLIVAEICPREEEFGKCLMFFNAKLQKNLAELGELSTSVKNVEQNVNLKSLFAELQALLSEYEDRFHSSE